MLSTHSEYKKLQSGSTKEALFNAYKKELAGEQPEQIPATGEEEMPEAKPDDNETKKLDKAARAEASLKAREESYKKEREKLDKRTRASKSALMGDEAEREYRTLLIDLVRNHKVGHHISRALADLDLQARWREAEDELARDERFNVNVSGQRKRDLFEEHVDGIYNKRLNAVKELLEREFKTLNDKFEDVYERIREELPIKVLDVSMSELRRIFEDWQSAKFRQAIKDLKELLKESSFVGYWGRVKKGEEGQTKDAEMVFKEEVDEEEETDEGVFGGGNRDLKKLAQQVNIDEMEKVLANDSRFRILDHWDKRREVIVEYSSSLDKDIKILT